MVRARELKFWDNVQPPPQRCHVSHVTCHVSHVTCHVSHVTCHMSHVTFFIFFIFFFKKWWSLLVKGLLSTGPTPSSLRWITRWKLYAHFILLGLLCGVVHSLFSRYLLDHNEKPTNLVPMLNHPSMSMTMLTKTFKLLVKWSRKRGFAPRNLP